MEELKLGSICEASKLWNLLLRRRPTAWGDLVPWSGLPFRGIESVIQHASPAGGARSRSVAHPAGIFFQRPVRGGAPR